MFYSKKSSERKRKKFKNNLHQTCAEGRIPGYIGLTALFLDAAFLKKSVFGFQTQDAEDAFVDSHFGKNAGGNRSHEARLGSQGGFR